MKTNILRAILIILLIGTCFTVFNFSNQDGKKSGSISKKITIALISNIKQVEKLDDIQKEEVLLKTERVIRKLAHFSIYTVIGILLMGLMSTYDFKENKRILISLLIGIIYASSDEIHQLFIPGRTAKVTDVMIDTMGVLLGILLIMLFIKVGEKIVNNNNRKK